MDVGLHRQAALRGHGDVGSCNANEPFVKPVPRDAKAQPLIHCPLTLDVLGTSSRTLASQVCYAFTQDLLSKEATALATFEHYHSGLRPLQIRALGRGI